MSIDNVFRELKESRVDLAIDSGKLQYSCPRGGLSAQLQHTIRAHKDILVRVFRTAAGITEDTSRRPIADHNLPIAPWLAWYLETFDPREHDWVINLLIRLPGVVSVPRVETAVNELISRHDAFQLRLAQDPSGRWTLFMAGAVPRIEVAQRDLSRLPKEERLNALRSVCRELRERLSALGGPVIGAAVCELGGSTGHAVLLSVHHNVVDRHSIQLILQEFLALYEGSCDVERSILRPRPITYRDYLFGIHSLACRQQFIADSLAFWLESGRTRSVQLPRDFANGRHTVSTSRCIETPVNADVMKRLCVVAGKRGVRVQELFVHALCETLHCWSGSRYVTVDVEHHGRGALGPTVNLMNTVGPMTVKVPLVLDAFAVIGDLSGLAREMQECVEHAAGYGLLRYCCAQSAVRQMFAQCNQAQILLNNRISVGLRASGPNPANPPRLWIGGMNDVDPAARDDPVSHDILIECDGSREGAVIKWGYSVALHRKETVELLANRFLSSICAFH